MSIQLCASNSLISLSELLFDKIKSTQSVFRPIYIVTQTEGMNNWLKLQIAQKLGIAANISFPRPNDMVHKVFQILGGSYTESISAHDLNWLLFQILDDKDFRKKYPEIAAYYDQEVIGKDVKRMALAEKIADLFDQYQIYRSDMMASWDQGVSFAPQTGLKYGLLEKFQRTEQWQMDLWQQSRKLSGSGFPDKNSVGNYILSALKDPDKVALLRDHLPEIYFFGISLITSYHLKIFHALAKHIDITFLMQNPAPSNYWFEDKSQKVIDFLKRKGFAEATDESIANPLLVGWGKLIQNTFFMLFEQEDMLNTYDEFGIREPKTDTLLHTIQNTIFNNQKEAIFFPEQLISDGSVTINSCYSPAREVEALYNYLVHLIDKKGASLSPRDIVVSVTDIDLYASYIKAVFDNAPYRFSYTIADESYAATDSIFSLLSDLLSLTDLQFTSEKVVSLLQSRILRDHFNIHNIQLIRNVVRTANIRFGFAGNKQDESIYVSWQYGMRRIMYGLCMAGTEQYGSGADSFFPLDVAEGADIAEITKFVYFVDLLIDSIKERSENRTTADWVRYIQSIINRFIGTREDVDDEDYDILSDQLERYNVLNEIFTGKVSYEVFSHHFLPTLNKVQRSKSFASGGITFCSLIPMRSIPFEVVAVLGMDYDKFPRKDSRVSFDLMAQKKYKGDRDIKENDKHLFLETLLSAEKYLYISYIGQSIKDNSEQPPSALIDELIDFIANHSYDPETVRKNLVVHHPLHGFSKKYNSNQSSLYSYLLSKNTQPRQWMDVQRTISNDFEEINAHHFAAFLIDPIKGYYNDVLHIRYDNEDETLSEVEVFELNNLEEWNLRTELFEQEIADIEDFRIQKVKKGEIPLRNMGLIRLKDIKESIEIPRSTFLKLKGDAEAVTINIDIEIENTAFTGDINGIYGDKYIEFSASKYYQKYLSKAFIRYLFLTACGHSLAPHFINKEGQWYSGEKMNRADAQSYLTQLFNLYKQGHEEIIPFNFSLLEDYKKVEKMDQASFLKMANTHFNNERISHNAYEQKEYENGLFHQEGMVDRYKDAIELVWFRVADFWGEPQQA